MMTTRRAPTLAGLSVATLCMAGALLIGLAPRAEAAELCGKYDSVAVEGGRYIVQNNVWGASTAQCISVNGASFTVTTSEHDKPTNGSPAAYPSIYVGCHYENCTTGTSLPLEVSQMGSVTSSWSTSHPDTGTFNTAYDLWYDPNPNQPAQNAGELMIWLNYQGDIQPAGQRVATGVNIAGATYDVWIGDLGWNVISYVRTNHTTSVSGLDLTAFTQDAVNRGAIQSSWYLTSVQAGFEPWKGGTGLSVQDFSVSVSAGTATPSSRS